MFVPTPRRIPLLIVSVPQPPPNRYVVPKFVIMLPLMPTVPTAPTLRLVMPLPRRSTATSALLTSAIVPTELCTRRPSRIAGPFDWFIATVPP